MPVKPMPRDWEPRTPWMRGGEFDVVSELDHIAGCITIGVRLPPRDPYLADVCLLAIREILNLRATLPPPPPIELPMG